jgi:hypothetical protein
MLTKAQFLEELRAGHPKYLTSKHHDVRVRVYSDTAVVTAHSTLAVESNGKVSEGPRRFMNVYVSQDGVWRLVAHQGTRVTTQQSARVESIRGSGLGGALPESQTAKMRKSSSIYEAAE